MSTMQPSSCSRQRGVSLSGLIAWLIVAAALGLIGIKVVPELINYASALKVIKAVANDPDMAEAPDGLIQNNYGKRADIDNITDVRGEDLVITRDTGKLVISFEYTKKIPLFGPVSLTFDFKGESDK
jgi:hypothetical protein